jgi:hypothetical protein
MTRSQMAFIRGVFGRVLMICSSSALNVHGEIPGLLHRPRVCGHAAQVQSAGAVVDEHQHVQPLEQIATSESLSAHAEPAVVGRMPRSSPRRWIREGRGTEREEKYSPCFGRALIRSAISPYILYCSGSVLINLLLGHSHPD